MDTFHINEESNAVVPNELLYGNSNRYIWFDGDEEQQTEAQSLFGYLLQRKIYVKGFAVNYEPEAGMRMFNKPFVNIRSLDSKKDMLIVDRYYPEERYGNCVEAKKPNPSISRNDNIVIWGAGRNGRDILAKLKRHQLIENVVCLIDSNDAIRGKKTEDGKQICEPEILEELDEGTVLIAALEAWQAVDEQLKNKTQFRKYRYTIDQDRQIYPNGDPAQPPLFAIGGLGEIYTLLETKRTYVYGTGNCAKELVDYVRLLDGECGGLLADADEMMDMDEDVCKDFKMIENIIYEENYWIWIMTENRKKTVKKLEELGVGKFVRSYMNRNEYFFDVNLGFNWIKNGRCGIAVYGEEKEETYKIVILGGSTTDDTFAPFPSWAEILYEYIGRKDVVIYNGGCASYPSSLEFLKLARDMLSFMPDMVISFSGFNDSYLNHVQFPFSCGSMLRIYESAQRYEKSSDIGGYGNVLQGIPMKGDRFDHWLRNMEHMYAITRIHGISFYGFLQPMLASKKNLTRFEKNLLLSRRLKDYGKKRTDNMYADDKFRDYMRDRNVSETHDYIYDLSHIFDGISDVYVDSCHVCEKGNRIIALEIYKQIFKELDSWGRK